MARTIKVKSGSTTAELKGDLAKSIEKTLKTLAPESLAVIEKSINTIFDEAKSQWPRRKFKSQDSKSKLKKGITLDVSTGEIFGFISNDAPYAWAIKVGKETRIDLPLGARVSNELLWKPLKKQADPIAKVIAKEIERALKK